MMSAAITKFYLLDQMTGRKITLPARVRFAITSYQSVRPPVVRSFLECTGSFTLRASFPGAVSHWFRSYRNKPDSISQERVVLRRKVAKLEIPTARLATGSH